MIIGYKAFNKNFTNNYNQKFEVGKTYFCPGKIEYGVNGNGFHFCENIEDTLRFFNAMNEEIIICEVVGMGEILSYDDEYNGYYDMHVCSEIYISKVLSRDEIVNYFISQPKFRQERFIQGYKLTAEEISLFNSKQLTKTINYYQKNIKDAFE